MSHSCDETYAVYRELRVTARKPFECDCVPCSVTVRAGDGYMKVTTIHDGRVETIRRCLRCQHIHEHLRELGEDMWPDERLNCGHTYQDNWECEPPPEIAALAFWQPGEPLPCDSRCTAGTESRCGHYWRTALSFVPCTPGRLHARPVTCAQVCS